MRGGESSRKTHSALLRAVCGLACICVVAGCATSRQSHSRYLQQLEPASLTNVVVYRAGTNLALRFPIPGKDPVARASWTQPQADATPGSQSVVHHQFAALSFDDVDIATRRTVMQRGNRVAVRGPAQWQLLVRAVFFALVPTEHRHGIALLVQSEEKVVFRDDYGKLNVVNLLNKPPEIVVDRTLKDVDFSQQILAEVASGLKGRERDQTQFLFVTGDDPAFTFVDLRERLIVFLSYPSDPEAGLLETPGFALRALSSLIFKSFIVAAIKNPFTLVARGLWHLGSSGAAAIQSGASSSSEPAPALYTGEGMNIAEWETRLDKLVRSRRYKGRLDLLINGEKYFPALVESIENATRTIDILVFIFDNDDYAVKIADLLKARSDHARIRVLMDEMGSLFAGQTPPRTPMPPDFQQPSDIRSYLRSQSHVHVRAAANPWLTVDHRKCILIDERQAYIGGMNIGREYRYEWHDMMVRLTGPIVARLQKDFREAWAHAGPLGDYKYFWIWAFTRMNPHRLDVANAIDIRPLRTATCRLEIYRSQLEAIQRARRYIYIENGYFNDGAIVRELIAARHRGVDVRLVLPSENDSGIMQSGNLVMANKMIESGIRVYAYPGMTHVKAAIYDGWACLGSANFDKMSLRVSQELDIGFSDPAAVDRLKHDLFEADFSRSRELKTPVPLDWTDSVVKALAGQL
jgi:cardiolipin synthase A/B